MRKSFFHILFILLPVLNVQAQNSVRQQIDADRRSLSFTDEKTMEKAKGFIRSDSTYYIGYMYMGAFLFYRADDSLGFNLAIRPLLKAKQLIEKDYDNLLRTRSNDFFTYIRASSCQNDYSQVCYFLEQAYQNIEHPDGAFRVINDFIRRDLQNEGYLDAYNTMSWLYHRNRMYTSKNFSFLKNSVKANDSIAYLYLDSAIMKIQRDAAVNTGLFDPSYLGQKYYYTYHYKAILFTYDMQIDSAEFYYNLLLQSGYYSSNNYANFRYMMGDFELAEQFYQEAEMREQSLEKRTREYYYMRGLIDIDKGRPDDADSLLRRMVNDQAGSPGYGWHSIGLARALHYEGLTDESMDRTDKAGNFHELHISTTWGQEQYNLCVAMLKYINKQQERDEYYFENDEWWFWLNPVNWWKWSEYKAKVYKYKLILASLVAQNPERAQVVYALFSSENLLGFDEVWSLIDNFGNKYFIRIYKKELEEDKRPKIQKYFRYFLAKLYLSDGDKDNAKKYFDEVMDDPDINSPYEKLLYARTCEGLAKCVSGSTDKAYWTQKMYDAFPQLVPFSGLKMRFHLQTFGDAQMMNAPKSHTVLIGWIFILAGAVLSVFLYFMSLARKIKMDARFSFIPLLLLLVVAICIFIYGKKNPPMSAAAVTDDLKNCAVNFTEDYGVPSVTLDFTKTPEGMDVDYNVRNVAGDSLISHGTVHVNYSNAGDAGKLIAYRLFNINKTHIGVEDRDKGLLKKKKDAGSKDLLQPPLQDVPPFKMPAD